MGVFGRAVFTAFMVLSLSLGSGRAGATAIVNGDFATGDFTGWTTSAIDQGFAPIAPLLSVVPFGGGNAADFPTGTFADDRFIQTLEQSFVVDPGEPLFSFEFSLPDIVSDATGTGASSFRDALVVSLDRGTDFFELLLVDFSGALADPFGTAPGPVTLGAPTDPAFDFLFTADLSSLTGDTVTLFFDIINEDDGFQFNSPLMGVAKTGAPSNKAPLPASIWLFLIALGALRLRCHSPFS